MIDLPVTIEGDEGPLVCHAANGSADLTQVQKTVYQALLFMMNARFDAPLPWTQLTLWQWFRIAVNGIRLRGDIRVNFCCEPTRVINLLHPAGESTIPFGLLAMMVHEGRHAEGVRHTCDTFDHRISDMGAFGVQYSLYRWIGLHLPSATPAEREYALNAADLLRSSGAFCSECAE